MAWLGRSARIADAKRRPAADAVTTLRFALPRAQHVLVVVRDAAPRIVRTLHDGTLEPGEHLSCWDGLDDQGRCVTGGTYTIALEVDGKPLTSRIVTLR